MDISMAMSQYFSCDPAGIQTQDLQNRNLTLYSAKLRSPRVRLFRALTDDYVIIRALNASALTSKSLILMFFLDLHTCLYISRDD